jgi:hypothetical protein
MDPRLPLRYSQRKTFVEIPTHTPKTRINAATFAQ